MLCRNYDDVDSNSIRRDRDPIAVDRRQREVNVVNVVKMQSAQQCSNAAS